ncbi:LIC11177 family protein [Leptospira sp. SA-E8]|uniref:LIC11177 family protein n=1 Tax=Leptospira sp. SA-E8 TaxID=3422259 RepID=UPI003EC028A6
MADKKKTVLPDVLMREKLQKIALNEKAKASRIVGSDKGSGSDPKKDDGPGSKIYKAIDESLADLRYYFLEGEYGIKIADLFNRNESQFDRLGITPRRFLEFARESFDRFKQLQKKMPLEPMNKKGWEYLERSLSELIGKLNEKFNK